MAKVINGALSGVLGNLVAVKAKDMQIIRIRPRSRSVWSDKQKQSWKRFKTLTDFWNQFMYSPVQKIWKIADKGQRGINLFIKTNMPAFGPEGELIDPDKLHFSAGKLPLPHRFSAVRTAGNPEKIDVTWDKTEAPGAGSSDDELRMVIANDGKFTGPLSTGFFRKAGVAVIQSAGLETAQAVYLSFASDKRKMYSADQYFGL